METMSRVQSADTIRIIKDAVTYDLLPAEEGGYVVTVTSLSLIQKTGGSMHGLQQVKVLKSFKSRPTSPMLRILLICVHLMGRESAT